MKKLASLIAKKVKAYTEMLSLDNNKLCFFYQRSWATITRTRERIQPHSHDQSNISFAYYPLKPEHSGDIRFIVQPQNEIAIGLFHQEKLKLGLLKEVNKRNTPNIDLHIEEDDIVNESNIESLWPIPVNTDNISTQQELTEQHNLSEENKADIQEISDMLGISFIEACQSYIVCNKDKELTVNFILNMS